MTYFREAVVNTQELLDLLVKCENKVREREREREGGGERDDDHVLYVTSLSLPPSLPLSPPDSNPYQDRSQL